MTFYFLVVGLEAKRELDIGALRERRRLELPLAAALGGMAVPVLIYLAFNAGGPGAHGWGAAMSTDTAFALGVLALVAPRATRLRIRLLTLVVFDDLVALLVIAVVYSEQLSLVPLLLAAGLFAALGALRFAPAAWRGWAAAALGFGVWAALLESGIDPVIAGLAVGLVTGAYPPARTDLERATEMTRSFREQPTPQLARSAQRSVASAISANERLQYPPASVDELRDRAAVRARERRHPRGLRPAQRRPHLADHAGDRLRLRDRQAGRHHRRDLDRVAKLGGPPRSLSWPVIAGGGAVAGIGFTVALLISSIAFEGRQLDEAKLGVLGAALLASLVSWATFRVIARIPASMRARQISGTADDLLDLSDDVDPARDHIRGPEAAPITLVEYGDYQCSYCGQAEVVIRELLESFGDELRYVWRHLPLNDVHPDAQTAAEAAEAAAAQGRFWELHDRLLANQDALGMSDLERHAEEIGLDVDRFAEEVRRREHEERVADDVASADASGVAGTPTFFINGRRHQGAYDTAALTRAVRAAQTRASVTQTAAAS